MYTNAEKITRIGVEPVPGSGWRARRLAERWRQRRHFAITLGVLAVIALYAVALLVLAAAVGVALVLTSTLHGAGDVLPRVGNSAAGIEHPAGMPFAQASPLGINRQTEVFEGFIEDVAGGQFVLSIGGDDIRFQVEPGAAVRLDGSPASMADLKPGYWASVTAIELEDTILVATEIQAESEVSR